jgi:hypothetical protein
LVKETGNADGVSYYLPSINDSTRENLEMDCVTNGVLIRKVAKKRMYYKRQESVVGAANGVETNYVYAEWCQSGDVHGRPMTTEMLKKKGATL